MGTAQSELMIDYLQPLEVRLLFCAYSKVELYYARFSLIDICENDTRDSDSIL